MNGEPPIRDVALFEGHDPHDRRFQHDPPIRNRVNIGPNIYIEGLPNHINRKIRDACAFRGYNWEIHMHALPVLYAFVRETDDTNGWDQDQPLQIAIALSRLCHPTSIALEFAARVYAPGVSRPDDYVVAPALVAGHGNQAFIPDPNGRNWLTTDDVVRLPPPPDFAHLREACTPAR